MHFEILVEDKSCEILLQNIVEKIIGPNYTNNSWRIISYKGTGNIPRNLAGSSNPRKRLFLNQLPRLMQGYGKSLQNESCVIVVIDSDRKDCMSLKQELLKLHHKCNPRPVALYRIAVEESEAWLLGDRPAIKTAYPGVREAVLDSYIQDSICGTWELLADAIHQGDANALRKSEYPEIGKAKCRWAAKIGPYMDIHRNRSGSFQAFREGLEKLAG